MSKKLGILDALSKMGQDAKSLIRGTLGLEEGKEPTGFMAKALGSFTDKTDAEGITTPGRAKSALDKWPTLQSSGVSVGYQGGQTGRALRGLDYFAKINNAQVLLARDNWNAVYQAIQSNNRLPRLASKDDVDESTSAASPTIELGSTKIS
mgnify:FL=1|tara:strand:+ start:1822 stop:2274 length:453 start_codon:yes stop_codon:yes gene_type:complete